MKLLHYIIASNTNNKNTDILIFLVLSDIELFTQKRFILNFFQKHNNTPLS